MNLLYKQRNINIFGLNTKHIDEKTHTKLTDFVPFTQVYYNRVYSQEFEFAIFLVDSVFVIPVDQITRKTAQKSS